MNKYNVTFTKNNETLSKTVEAQDEGTAVALMQRNDGVFYNNIVNVELLGEPENTNEEVKVNAEVIVNTEVEAAKNDVSSTETETIANDSQESLSNTEVPQAEETTPLSAETIV